MLRRTAFVSALVLIVGLLSACVPAPASKAPDTAEVHRQYGQPAVSAPKGFVYQPDVRVVGGGRNAVLGGSFDGLSWQLDSHAPGMADVKVGDVLWATAIVVGRVAKLTRGADVTTAVLAPVPLTDVIRDGVISVDQPISSGELGLRSGGLGDVTTLSDTQPSVSDVGFMDQPKNNAAFQKPQFGNSGGLSANISGWEAAVLPAPDGVNINVARNISGFKAQVDFGLKFSHLRVASKTSIAGGVITGSNTAVKGLQELTVSLTGGAASPAADNTRIRLEIPVTVERPIDAAPPLVVQFKFSFLIATAFTGNNATIGASAKWKLAGGIGSENGEQLKPTFGVIKSLTNSIGGLSLGPSGVVFGMSMRVLLGLGVPGASIGPYVKLAAVVGVTNGSALGASLVRCHAATLDISAGVGAAAGISFDVVRIVRQKLAELAGTTYGRVFKTKNNVSTELSVERTTTIVSASETVPDVPLCKAS